MSCRFLDCHSRHFSYNVQDICAFLSSLLLYTLLLPLLFSLAIVASSPLPKVSKTIFKKTKAPNDDRGRRLVSWLCCRLIRQLKKKEKTRTCMQGRTTTINRKCPLCLISSFNSSSSLSKSCRPSISAAPYL